jgi:hypothetical protein
LAQKGCNRAIIRGDQPLCLENPNAYEGLKCIIAGKPVTANRYLFTELTLNLTRPEANDLHRFLGFSNLVDAEILPEKKGKGKERTLDEDINHSHDVIMELPDDEDEEMVEAIKASKRTSVKGKAGEASGSSGCAVGNDDDDDKEIMNVIKASKLLSV